MKKIVLIGYMGSGKSTIGKLLSASNNFIFYDLDEIIEKEQNLSVSTIFETKGEVAFRKIEHEALKKVLETNENMILSLGGGTPCFSNNQEILKEDGVTTVYLKTSVQGLYERLRHEKNHRPLLASKNDDEMKEYIAKHLFERSSYYSQADFSILTDGKSPQETVVAIQKLFN